MWEVPGTATASGDWAYGCDNQFSCTITSLGGGGEGDWTEGLRLDVKVAASPDGPPVAILSVAASPANDMGGEETWPHPSMVTSVAIDDEILQLDHLDEDRRLDSPAVQWIVRLPDLGRMARSKAITLMGKDGRVLETISTQGLYDALRHIERMKPSFPGETQRPKPVIYRKPQLMHPVRLPPFPPRMAMAMQRQANCPELELDIEEPPIGIFQQQIGAHDVLVLVSCAPAGPDGASGPSFLLPLILDQRSGSVAFAQFDFAPWNPDFARETLVPDSYFNDDEMVFHTFAYTRDFGDCGERADYVWDVVARRFVLIAKWAMPSCRSAATWIQTYQRPSMRVTLD